MIDFTPSLALIYAQFGEPVTIAGSPVTAIFDGGYIAALDVQSTAPALRCRASDIAAVAVGATVARAGVSYVVRAIEPVAPDELEKRLVLERQ
jgi:hypothetical protein